jgi:hypothetical protein
MGCAATAQATTVTFTQITGVAGGTPAATAIFRADLSGLTGQIASVTIQDNSSPSAGAPGQFSGFDLDAIVLSSVMITDASAVASLTPNATFNFATSMLTPGVQTPPTDPALFGTIGGEVNNAVATLSTFDGNSTTAIPDAFGFVSLGVGGTLSINLTTPITISGPEYLYIGEVGNNGEVAASNVTVSSTAVPEPASIAMLGVGLLALAKSYRSKSRQPN